MRRYNVRSTEQFDELWDAAVRAGVLDSEVDGARLESLAAYLAVDPRYFEMFVAPGESVDLRWVRFASAGGVGVDIWYSVVEDDLVVYLDSVEILRPPQQLLPGFDP